MLISSTLIFFQQEEEYNLSSRPMYTLNIVFNRYGVKMSISNEAVTDLIQAAMPDATVSVTGDGYKYQAEVISPEFEGLRTLKRHQKVYAAVNDAIISGELHALTITALTPDEHNPS